MTTASTLETTYVEFHDLITYYRASARRIAEVLQYPNASGEFEILHYTIRHGSAVMVGRDRAGTLQDATDKAVVWVSPAE